MAVCSQKRKQQPQQQQQQQQLDHVPQRPDSADTTSRPGTPVMRPSLTGMSGTPATPNSASLLDLSTGTPQTRDASKSGPFCPQPRRALPNQNPMMPGSPPFNFREETGEDETHAAGEGPNPGHTHHKGFGSRPLSSASTSEGATPAPDLDPRVETWLRSLTPSSSPNPDVSSALQEISSSVRYRIILENHGWNGREFAKMPNHEQLLKDLLAANKGCCVSPGCTSPPPGNGNSSKGKVFVGGVPQTMGQPEFSEFMGRWGNLRKAWLQKNRPPANGVGPDLSRPGQNHRGFGFAIYGDESCVDRLLGNKDSVFLNLSDHQRLEIKRAVCANELPAATTAGTPTPTPSRKPSWQAENYRRGSPVSPMDRRYLSRSPASNPTPTPQQTALPLIPPLELNPVPMAKVAAPTNGTMAQGQAQAHAHAAPMAQPAAGQRSVQSGGQQGEEQPVQAQQQPQQQQPQQQHQQVCWQTPMGYQAGSMPSGPIMVQQWSPMPNQQQGAPMQPGMQVACPPFPMNMGGGCCYAHPMSMPTMPMASNMQGGTGSGPTGSPATMMVNGMPENCNQGVMMPPGAQWVQAANGQMHMQHWQPVMVAAPQQQQHNMQQQQQQPQMLPQQLQPEDLAHFCGPQDLETRLKQAEPETYED